MNLTKNVVVVIAAKKRDSNFSWRNVFFLQFNRNLKNYLFNDLEAFHIGKQKVCSVLFSMYKVTMSQYV